MFGPSLFAQPFTKFALYYQAPDEQKLVITREAPLNLLRGRYDTMRGFLIAIAATVPLTQSYSGSWPLTVSRSQRSNGTYCLALSASGCFGWRRSGGRC